MHPDFVWVFFQISKMATPKKYVILKFMKDKRSWGFEKGDLEEIPLHWVIESIENGPATVWYPDPKQFSLEQTTKMKELGEDHPISQEAFDSNAFLKLSNVTVAADASMPFLEIFIPIVISTNISQVIKCIYYNVRNYCSCVAFSI